MGVSGLGIVDILYIRYMQYALPLYRSGEIYPGRGFHHQCFLVHGTQSNRRTVMYANTTVWYGRYVLPQMSKIRYYMTRAIAGAYYVVANKKKETLTS